VNDWNVFLRIFMPWMDTEAGWLGMLVDWLIFTVVPFLVLWSVAHYLVRRHLRRLESGEAAPDRPRVVTSGASAENAADARLLCANVVISHASVRVLPILYRRLVGGRIDVLRRMADRGRREALLRLEDQAREMNADRIVGLRFTAHAIGVGSNGGYLGVEIVAFGTGLAAAQPKRPVT